MTRPAIGTPDWGDDLNTDLDGIEAKADAALAGVDGLADQVAALPATFAPLDSPAFTGEPTVNGEPIGSGGGGALTDRGVWTTATAYVAGDVVTWQARRWCCGTAHTSGSNFDVAKFADTGALDPGFIIGEQLSLFGHSWVAYYASRLIGSLRTAFTVDESFGGAFIEDAAIKIERLVTPTATGVYVLHGVLNNAVTPLTSPLQVTFTNALRAWLDFARAPMRTTTANGAGRLDTNSGLASNWFTFTGTWTTTADSDRSSQQRKATTTQNDSVSLRWYGDAVTIVLLGQADNTGAAYAVTDPGGGTVASGSLSSQTKSAFGPVPVRLSGYGPGWHEVTLAKTDAGSTILALDCLLVPSPALPATIVLKEPPVSATFNANIGAYNDLVDAVSGEAFTAGSGAPITLLPSAGTSWDTAVDIDQTQNHPTSAGTDKLWRRILTLIAGLPYRPGVVARPSVVPAVTPAALADNFTRANSTFRPGSTSTGGRGWSASLNGDRYGITSNQLVQTVRSNYFGSVQVDCGKADTTVSWTIGALGGGNVGLVFRALSDTKFYMLHGGSLYRVDVGAGTFPALTALTGATPTFGASDVIQAVCNGSSITLRKNGSDVATYTDSAYAAGTRYGMGNFDGLPSGGLSAVNNT